MPPAACEVLLVTLPISYSTEDVALWFCVLLTGPPARPAGFRAGVRRNAHRRGRRGRGGSIVVLVVLGLGFDHLAVRVEFFLGARTRVVIDLGRDAHDRLAGAEDFFEHVLRLFAEVLLEVAAGDELRAGQAGHGIVVGIFRKRIAQVVNDGDVVRLQPFHGIRHEETDGVDGRRRQLRVAAHAHENGRGRIFVLVEQQAVFRQHDHHARRRDLVNLADGAGKFALHGAGVVRALDEIRDAEVRLVENLEAHAFALRNALGRQLHPHRINLVLRHQDRTAAGLVGNLGVVERGDDLGGLGIAKSRHKAGRNRRAKTRWKARPARQPAPSVAAATVTRCAAPSWLQMSRNWPRSLERFWFI